MIHASRNLCRLAALLVVCLAVQYTYGQDIIRSFSSQYRFAHKWGLANVGVVFWTPGVETSGKLPVDLAFAAKTQGWVAVGYNLGGELAMTQGRVVVAQNIEGGSFNISERSLNAKALAGISQVTPVTYINASAGIDTGGWMWLKYTIEIPTSSPTRTASGTTAIICAARTVPELDRHNYLNTGQMLNLANGEGANSAALCDPSTCEFGECSEFSCDCDETHEGPTCSDLKAAPGTSPAQTEAPNSPASSKLIVATSTLVLGLCTLLFL